MRLEEGERAFLGEISVIAARFGYDEWEDRFVFAGRDAWLFRHRPEGGTQQTGEPFQMVAVSEFLTELIRLLRRRLHGDEDTWRGGTIELRIFDGKLSGLVQNYFCGGETVDPHAGGKAEDTEQCQSLPVPALVMRMALNHVPLSLQSDTPSRKRA